MRNRMQLSAAKENMSNKNVWNVSNVYMCLSGVLDISIDLLRNYRNNVRYAYLEGMSNSIFAEIKENCIILIYLLERIFIYSTSTYLLFK